MKKSELSKVKGHILRAATSKLKSDVQAYVTDYAPLVIFTLANGGTLVVGVHARMPDGSDAMEAMQNELHGPAEPVAEVPDADAPAVPTIEVVSR